MFTGFAMAVNRAGMGAVWRMEVQKRGAAHWHMLFGAPFGFVIAQDGSGVPVDQAVTLWVRATWSRLIGGLGPSEWVIKKTGDTFRGLRSSAPGYDQHGVDVEAMGDQRAGWFRYMFDHTTKSKQEQVGESGRHWGIINRAVFVESGSELRHLHVRQFYRLHRMLRKWNRPRVRLPDKVFQLRGIVIDRKDPWQTRLGFESKRGLRGAAVWYGHEVFAKMLDFVQQA